MKWKTLIVIIIFGAQSLWAVELKIRLFSTETLDAASVIPDTGDYFMIALDREMRPVDTVLDVYEEQDYRNLHFQQKGKSVSSVLGDLPMGVYHGILLKSRDPRNEFRIEAAGKQRVYHGDLRLRIHNNSLQVVNIVDMEHYVAGVVESEGGHINQPEFFKAQAVLARTFALKNIRKHHNEGYNLKDDVTSQVYFSRARHKFAEEIIEAVRVTKDTVVVTYDCEPILGVFHANSGGYCTNAEDVWLQPVEYLRAKVDSFSIGVGSYSWERQIPEQEFYSYFARELGVEQDIFLQKALLNFDHQPRQAYFQFKDKRIKLTKVRRDFNLRSTFFEVFPGPDGQVVLKGRGYGHGVGLSQDGAIEMARRGYSYREIIDYYYEGVELESIHMIKPISSIQ